MPSNEPVWDILENRWMTRREWDEITAQLDRRTPRGKASALPPLPRQVPPPGHVWDILENRWMPEAEWDEVNRHIRKRLCRL
jgi:hypothetical protein